MPYLATLLARSRRLFLALVKVMLPVMIAVRLGQEMGLVDALARAIAPAVGWLGLPPEAGMIWVTGVFVGVYGAIGALVGFAPTLEMSVAQFSALAAMVLFAHGVPVEQAIVRRAGASFWVTAGLRIGAALAYGAVVTWACARAGVLAEPVSFGWLQGGMEDGAGRGGLVDWLVATAFSMVLTFGIIVALLVLLDVLERTGVTRRITALMAPVLRVSGLPPVAAPVTTVGVLLGLTYGGALIIEEAERQHFDARTRFLALSWLSLSHSLIEDTLLFLALGADIWIVLVGRVLLTMAIVAGLAVLLRDAALPAGEKKRAA
jgi:hypothetical protein